MTPRAIAERIEQNSDDYRRGRINCIQFTGMSRGLWAYAAKRGGKFLDAVIAQVLL